MFHPRTVLLCGVCTPCTLFYLGRCVAGDDGLYTHLYSRVHTRTSTHTQTQTNAQRSPSKYAVRAHAEYIL